MSTTTTAIAQRVARMLFQARGNKSEAHLNELELATICEAAAMAAVDLVKPAGIFAQALRDIIAKAPEEEPEEENYDDTESAYTNGCEVAHYEAAEIARRALAAVRGQS